MVWSIKTTDDNLQTLEKNHFGNELPTLEQMQEAVGGYIEFVRITSDGAMMVVNEEGLLKKLPYNKVASIMANQTIVGDVLIFSKKEMEEMG